MVIDVAGKRMIGPRVLYWSWLVHDMEEVWGMRPTLERLRARGYTWLPQLSDRDVAVAITMMGGVFGLAATAGERTQGRSWFYRLVAAGYEAHAFTHIASSLITRQYTAGVATAIPVILPAGQLIRKELRTTGHPLTWKNTARGLSLFVPTALVVHGTVRLVTGALKRVG